MINTPSGLALLSTVFLIIGIIALVAQNKTISTRHKSTQIVILLISIGGLIGMKGHYGYGITISVVAIIIYFIRWRRFKKDQTYYRRRGMPLPECKKP